MNGDAFPGSAIRVFTLSAAGAVGPLWLPWYVGFRGGWRTAVTVALYFVQLVIGLLLTRRELRREHGRFLEAERIRIEQDREPGSVWVAFEAWTEQRRGKDPLGGSGHDRGLAQR